jgi:glycosyltransferase involved in cell wall biosynthesis
MILFLTRQMPYPPDIGPRIRQRNLLEACSKIAPVQLVFSYNEEEDLADLSDLEHLCADIHPVRMEWRGKPLKPSLVHLCKELSATKQLVPFRSRLFFSKEIRQLVEQLAPACRLIHVERLHMVTHVQNVLNQRNHKQRMILDLDDIETDVRREWLRLSPPEGWRAHVAKRLDLAVLGRYQQRTIQSFDRVLIASEADRRRLGGGPELGVIPNGADVGRGPLPDESDGRTLLCLGTYGYWPNVDGLHHFLENILPLVHREIPDVRLLVVGRDMPPEVARLHDAKHILVSADVPDVEPFYRKASVSVVPLRLGGGTRLKILEAFALGTPVVSTTVGCAGIDVVPGEHLLVADDHAAFARACVELLRDPGRRAALAKPARELVEQHHSWDSIRSKMSDLIASEFAKSQAAQT